MARPLRIEYPGAFYHITSRGNEQQNIFKSDSDRIRFLSYLESAVERYKAVIHVYCLMNNHYHLLLETPMGNLSQIMRHINGAYTTYYNTKRKRFGHLLQGRYKAILIEADEYAEELSRYIHLNPVRAGIRGKLEEYQWSSYQYYIGKKQAPKWLTVDYILSYFGRETATAQKKYNKYVNALITDKGYDNPLKDTKASAILGGNEFINEIRDKYLSGKKIDRNQPSLRELKRTNIKEIISEVKEILGKNETISRKAAIYLCHRYSGRTLREIGKYFGIGESAISQTSRRFNILLDKNKKLNKKVEDICSRLKVV